MIINGSDNSYEDLEYVRIPCEDGEIDVGYINEDELPEWVDDKLYDLLYPASSVVDGVRMFPFVVIDGVFILLFAGKGVVGNALLN